MNIKKGFDAIKENQINYFKQYTFEKPIVFTLDTNEELRALGKILYKALFYLINNYEKFLHLMPRDKKELEIFEICKKYPYKVGTFRTDFVLDKNNQIKIIEMTTRQPLNGYFTSGFFKEIAFEQAERWGINNIVDCYSPLFEYLENYIGDVKHICVIKGNNKLEEIYIYPEIFKIAGKDCHIIPIDNLRDNLHLLNDCWVIEELTFDEIKNFDLDVIERLAKVPMHNNFLSLFHTHDKRFFSLLNNKSFLDSALDESEQKILSKYIVRTFIPGENDSEWGYAKENKNEYILKHQHKGKSVDIYPGIVTEEQDWIKLFDSEEIQNFILQEFIDTKIISGKIGIEDRNDYVAGTLLYFNEEYFGPGLFRTSSYPVTNIKDNRKIAQLVIDSNNRDGDFYYL